VLAGCSERVDSPLAGSAARTADDPFGPAVLTADSVARSALADSELVGSERAGLAADGLVQADCSPDDCWAPVDLVADDCLVELRAASCPDVHSPQDFRGDWAGWPERESP
jgi:hypothetical protein